MTEQACRHYYYYYYYMIYIALISRIESEALQNISPSIIVNVYRDCFHLREAIFLSNSLQKLTQITIILIIDHHITLLK